MKKRLFLLSILIISVFAFSGCSFVSEINSKSTGLVVSPGNDIPALDVCSNTIVNDFGGGNGEVAYPFLICNVQQWNYFATTTSTWDKHIKLAADLDFSGIVYADLKTLTDATITFTGQFDGNNKKILNINVNAGAVAFSLFGKTSGTPTIKNLTVENVNLTSTAQKSLLVDTNAASSTLTFQNITLKDIVFSTNGAGLVYLSTGDVHVDGFTVLNISMPTQSNASPGVVELYGSATFDHVLIDGFTQSYTCCAFPVQIAGLVAQSIGIPTPNSITVNNTVVRNITLGGSTVVRHVGGLIGRTYDSSISISNSSVTGTIYAKDSGALVATLEQFFSANRTFSSTNNSTNVNFTDCGNGLCGGISSWLIVSAATIDRSVARGNCTNWTGNCGGLVSQINGNLTVNDSYAIGNYNKTGNSGSLGGLVSIVATGTTTINRSFFAGTLTMTGGGAPVHGCNVAANFATLVLNDVTFDDTLCLSNAVNAAGFGGSVGQSTAALKAAVPFTNWLPSVWVFDGINYPKLVWEF